ncbi:hypothetical protein A1Q2_01084 [Trichosporon asahii var. asahii CBS 8904]|uniref:U3 small nucleolar RNA-associated protein 6 N-terminal domain-containing protein n=1 Tax=Trichosporon asahii var. asahii (strain CBS 8904) TaxID=1220162 RepID=K1WUV7_TRIAC|nr:hypothetical protein A1Q2_01084 [Trichosporon asahii var. asahii CBS 8904]
MEKVQFQLEGTLPELKDLHEKGLFSRPEIQEITKRRTAFETALVRRQARKDDFFKYAEYEINLEKLRKIRWKKLTEYDRNPPPPSASTYSIPRRVLYILKRATAKFPGDLAVWLAYVEFGAREGMTKIVAKGLNSALQHHPLSPTLYLLQSYHHLHPGTPLPRSGEEDAKLGALAGPALDEARPALAFALEGTGPARTTLLLGLRLLPGSHALWRAYVKLELGWVEALRRRWRALGIEGAVDSSFDGDQLALKGGEGSFGPEGEEARRAILSGQLVLAALSEALKKVSPTDRDAHDAGSDGIQFRADLLTMLRAYPSPLRSKALEAVYADLQTLSTGQYSEETRARAALLLLTRGLYDREYVPGETVLKPGEAALKGSALVDFYAHLGSELKGASGAMGTTAGLWLLDQLSALEPEMRAYVLGLLGRLTRRKAHPSPDLLLRHLDAVAAYGTPTLALVRKHAALYPGNAVLQLARVNAEVEASEAGEDEALDKSALEGMFASLTKELRPDTSSPEDVDATVAIWTEWALSATDMVPILRASLRSPIPSLHSRLLSTWFFTLLSSGLAPSEALKKAQSYAPGSEFYAQAFEQLAQLNGEEGAMRSFYDAWKRNSKGHEVVVAALAYARWLVDRRKGREARTVVETAKRQAREFEGELEEGWERILEDAEREEDEELEDEEIESDESEEEEERSDDEDESEDDEGDVQMGEEEDVESHDSSDLEIAM